MHVIVESQYDDKRKKLTIITTVEDRATGTGGSTHAATTDADSKSEADRMLTDYARLLGELGADVMVG